jgi:hypothetical protein
MFMMMIIIILSEEPVRGRSQPELHTAMRIYFPATPYRSKRAGGTCRRWWGQDLARRNLIRITTYQSESTT